MDEMKYFATIGTDEIGDAITQRVDDYNNHITSNGMLDLWTKSYKQYYSGYYYGGSIKHTGSQGELIKSSVNHYRNILQHILTMSTSQRLNFEPKAINTDYKSISQTILAKNLLEYYVRAEHVEKYLNEAGENAAIFGEGAVYSEWDFNAGDVVGLEPKRGAPVVDENGQPVDPEQVEVKGGDLKFYAYTPRDVVRDVNATEGNGLWYILVNRMNRYELASKYKDFEEKILEADSDNTERFVNNFADVGKNTDNITVYKFIHRKSGTLPNGRLVECLDDGTVMFDGDLPYTQFPLYFMTPSMLKDTAHGYTIGFDLLQLQDSFDGLYSTVLSNNNAFGVQNIAVAKGSDITVTEISEGMNLLYYTPANVPGGGKPEAMQLTQSSPESYKLMDMINQFIQTISGVNSVARGNPEASLKSGAALALVQSMAIQFNSMYQNAFAYFAEELGTGIIGTLQKYAKSPRVAMISGKSNRSYMREFVGDDIANITRVVVDLGSALMRTTSGRLQVADTLMERGKIATPEEYMQIIDSGRLEPLIEGDRNEIMLIRSENEKMMAGEAVQAIAVDNHTLHVKEHKSVLASPELRVDETVVTSTLNHINEHIELMRTVDPDLLGVLGMQSLMQPAMPPVDADGLPPMEGEAQQPNMPSMPTNPLTGEQAPDPSGSPYVA